MGTQIFQGDALVKLKEMEAQSIHCCVTSPPYWGLRNYDVEGQLGLEKTPEEYVSRLVEVFREVKRVLRDDGTLWLNLGDSYANAGGKAQPHRDSKGGMNNSPGTRTQRNALAATGFERPSSVGNGIKTKDLIGIPWRVAFALQADGWYLRQDIIWHKPNPMPESVRDRCTKAHEYIFLLSKSSKYYFDYEAIQEPCVDKRGPGNIKEVRPIPGQRIGENSNLRGNLHKIEAREKRNKRSVWTVTTKSFKKAHFATFPPDLIEPCILAGCPVNGTVLDPFLGSGTSLMVADRHSRNGIGIELNPAYVQIAQARITDSR